MEEPGFWDEPEQSTRMVRESKNLKDEVDTYRALEQQYEDIQVMIQMGYEENDSSLIPEIEEMLEQFKETLENMRMKLLLSGEYDSNNAILRLNAGAGGTESCAEDMFVDTVQPLLSCRPLPVSLIGSSTSAFERFKNLSTTVTS